VSRGEIIHSQWPRKRRGNLGTSTKDLLFFTGKYLTDTHPFLIERYKKERLTKVKPARLHRELAFLNNVFTKA